MEAECFGQFKKNDDCFFCDHAESCEYCTGNEKEIKTSDKAYENRKGRRTYIDDIKFNDIMGFINSANPKENSPKFSERDMIKMIKSIIELTKDDTFRAVLYSKMGSQKTFAEIARENNMSRSLLNLRLEKELKRILGFHMDIISSKKLTKKEIEFYRLRHIEELTMVSIAKEMGICRKTCYNITHSIGSKLNKKLHTKKRKNKKKDKK